MLIFVCSQAIYLALFAYVSSLPALYVNGALFGLGYGGVLLCYPIIVRELMPAAQAGRRTGIIALCASGMPISGSNRTRPLQPSNDHVLFALVRHAKCPAGSGIAHAVLLCTYQEAWRSAHGSEGSRST